MEVSEPNGKLKSRKEIPQFYFKLPPEDDPIALKLREDARAEFLRRKSNELLNDEEITLIKDFLSKHHTPPILNDKLMVNYTDFIKVSKLVNEKSRKFFTPKIFSKLLENDPFGRISVFQFHSYIMRKVWYSQTRIGLSVYDESGRGYLKEVDLMNYVEDLIPTLPKLSGLEKSFISFYSCTAVRKFFFFLDPLRTRQIRIRDILACGFMDDFLELRDEGLRQDIEESNWFSAHCALEVYGQYLNLDEDRNGMLSKKELLRYGRGTLTNVFVDRVFQECVTYDGEIDYKTFVDVVLALDNRKHPQSLQYFFKLFNVRGKGYIDEFCLHYFFRAIQEQLLAQQIEVPFENIRDEIFDMVKPANSEYITLQDLINCGRGHTVVSILIDVDDFCTHEARHNSSAEDSSDE